MKKSVIFVFAVLFLFCFQIITPGFGADMVAYASEYQPVLHVKEGLKIPEIEAGSMNELTFPIKNTSNFTAKNVIVTLEPMDSSKVNLVFEKMSVSETIYKISPKKMDEATFRFTVSPDTEEGIYSFKLKYEYNNSRQSSFTTYDTINMKVVNKNANSKVVVKEISLNPKTAVPGKNMDLYINLINRGTLPANDIKVKLTGLDSKQFTTYQCSNVKNVYKIGGLSNEDVKYTLVVSDDLPSGNYGLDVEIKYKDSAGKEHSESSQVFIPVNNANDGIPKIKLSDINYPQNSVNINEDFKVSFNLTNEGKGNAHNIKVELGNPNVMIMKSLNTMIISDLAVGETKNIEFILSATSSAKSDNYPIPINIEYEEGEGSTAKTRTIKQYIGINIESSGGSETVPKIIVDDYGFEPEVVKAGKEFDLKLSFFNTNKELAVKNIKVTLSSDDGTFTPTESSNTFYIEEIKPRENAERSIKLYTKNDVVTKSYELKLKLEYEDENGIKYDKDNETRTSQYQDEEVISIPIKQDPRLVVSEFEVPQPAFVGMPINIYTDFYNMGKTTLYNLMVKVEGEGFSSEGSDYFVGNFSPGTSDYYDGRIVPDSVGPLKASLVFTFEDDLGNQLEERKDFTVSVEEMSEPEMGMEDEMGFSGEGPDMPEDKGGLKNNKTMLFIIIGVIAVAVIITIIVIRKKRSKREGLTFDE